MSKPRLTRVPEKKELGSWNFKAAEMRDGHTRWLVECDCKRIIKWLSPSSIHPTSKCELCANEHKKAAYALGKKMTQEQEEVKEPLRAPEGQLSLSSLPKDMVEKASPELKVAIQDACDEINNAYKEGTRMKLYMYSFCSIDYDWERLPKVKDYLKDTLFKEQLATMGLKTTDGDFYKTLYLGLESAQSIAAALKKCLEYAEKNMCWDNTFCEEPRIFFIPAVGLSYGFSYGFAWKIRDNGMAYIASPMELSHIEEYYGCDKGIVHI
jgi:hypothetical protein